MRMIAYDGVAVLTTDAVADAVLDLAIIVARFSSYERVTIPVLVHGDPEELTLMLGPTIHISTLTDATKPELELEGASDVAAALRRRTETFLDPLADTEEWEAVRIGR